MNITITIPYKDLQKIITESATMRTLVYQGKCPIINCKNRFLGFSHVRSMEEHQKNIPGSSKISAIKYLREQFHLDSNLKDKLLSMGCSINNDGNLGLADSKQIVEKYFY